MIYKKNKQRIFGIILLCFSFFSCNTEKHVRSHLNKCIKSKTNEVFEDVYGDTEIDIYEMVDSIEKNFLQKSVLKSITKEEYLSLINFIKLKDGRLLEDKVVNKFSSISTLIVVDMVSTCSYEVIIEEKNKLDSSVVNQFKIGQKLLSTSYDLDQMIEYVESIHPNDFKYIEYRVPVMVMLLFNIERINQGSNW